MIELPVYNRDGQEVDSIQIDEMLLGEKVRHALLKQAVVMYHANRRQGTASTKSRSSVAGSTHKLYRQKGTGRARMGSNRTVIRKGGGVAFAKRMRDFSQRMPKKQRRMARNSAVLSKLQSNDVVVIDQLAFDQPRTRDFAAILQNLNIEKGRSCLVVLNDYNLNTLKSLRNIPRLDALEIDQLNAGAVCNHRKLFFTREALDVFLNSCKPGNGVAAATE